MRLKIVSPGIGMLTKIINADTGEQVENVLSVDWHADSHECIATIVIDRVEAEVIGVGNVRYERRHEEQQRAEH